MSRYLGGRGPAERRARGGGGESGSKRFVLGDKLQEDVRRLATELHTSEEEVIRRAIELAKLAVAAERTVITMRDGRVVRPRLRSTGAGER
ncbi:MAG: hypothetical protein HC945_03985 [Nitrosarchaeum sp.]|nr:hypothetical protein [Nitrosarchaeum sp.]